MLVRYLPAVVAALASVVSVNAQQYKASTGIAPAADIPAPFASLLAQGTQITDAAGKPYGEVWFKKTAPNGPKQGDDAVTLGTIPVGSFIGVVRFDANGSDRRGQQIKAGVYSLRYAWMPNTGTHVGAAPQRDFGLLIRIADDKDPSAAMTQDQVINLSRQASGTGHPLVLSMSSGSGADGFTKEGDHDWTLHTKIGDLSIDIIVIGKVDA